MSEYCTVIGFKSDQFLVADYSLKNCVYFIHWIETDKTTTLLCIVTSTADDSKPDVILCIAEDNYYRQGLITGISKLFAKSEMKASTARSKI
ncbi:unnamed protein product [Cylicocyclus nassatus]|uniref:Uncharacterized protein n=1 Tax=Cylicocyclus nassatus TaxID=53992 RepID=A0AA36DMV4_CYLNA|nr:unnamed protein product [Cylicocyclus nassatus]